HLPLFLGVAVLHEHIDVGNEVEGDALRELLGLDVLQRVDRFGLAVEFVHRILAGAGHRLVGGDDYALDGGVVVQGLERDNKLRSRAVRVGDDVLGAEAGDRVGVDLGHDQGNVGVVAPGRGIVDHNGALRADLWRPLPGHRTAGRHQADVDAGEI